MEEVKLWLRARHMTQGDLARALGFATAHVNRVLNGKMVLSDRFRWRFAELYGYDTARELLGRPEEAAA